MNAYQPVNISVTVQLTELRGGGRGALYVVVAVKFLCAEKMFGTVSNVAELEC